jgi:hypothetical protein
MHRGFSRVGFNAQMDEALVYYEYRASQYALAGGGEILYLHKGQDGVWTIDAVLADWQS